MRTLFALLCLAALVALPAPTHAATLDCSSANAAVALQLQRGVWDADLAHALRDAYTACQGAGLPTPQAPRSGPVHPPVNPYFLLDTPTENLVNPAGAEGCRAGANTYAATYTLAVAGPPVGVGPFFVSPSAANRYNVPGTALLTYDPASSPHTSTNGETNDLSFGMYADSTRVGWVYLYDAPIPARTAALKADCGNQANAYVCSAEGYSDAWAGLYNVIVTVNVAGC
jgi:hypothetical protein